MFKSRILEDLKKVVGELGYDAPDIVCSIPKNTDFGDYTTNLALQLAKSKSGNGKHSPESIAKEISAKIKDLDYLEKVEPVGGFINFFIKPDALMESLHKICDYSLLVDPQIESETQKKKVMVEFTDPNPFKEFHIGHLFTNSVGESLSRLLGATGAEVKRANYFGDVGMHVAKSVWGMMKKGKDFDDLEKKTLLERVKWLGEAYALGAKAFEEDKEATEEIKNLNLLVYIASQDYMAETVGFKPEIDYSGGEKVNEKLLKQVKKLYAKGREWSLEYFETIYQILGTKFDFYYPESIVGEFGMELVKKNLENRVFEESEGAIIFPGDKYGLHKRVFINSMGLPTYEAKELGLAFRKQQDFDYDTSIIITGAEIKEYFQVLMMALSQIDPELARKAIHIPHGMVRMVEGKMSSRTGNVITFEWLYEMVREKVKAVMKESKLSSEEIKQVLDVVSVGALKFALLKHDPKIDTVFDLDRSVALHGDSGPYVQYTFARAKSVLRNGQYNYNVELPHSDSHPKEIKHELEKEERLILQKIEYFQEIVEESARNLAPQQIAGYLLELASLFNLFYQKHPILKAEEKQEFRLALTCAVAVVLKQGLFLLGIDVPERM